MEHELSSHVRQQTNPTRDHSTVSRNIARCSRESTRRIGAHRCSHATAPAFTLLELLVTITISMILAGVVFMVMRSSREKVWAATSTQSLRQCAVAIHGFVQDHGHFPEAWDFDGGGAWTWQIRDHVGGGQSAAWPPDLFLHPRHGKWNRSNLSAGARRNLTHYAASCILLQDNKASDPTDWKTLIRPLEPRDPNRLIMIGDAPLKKEGDVGGGCHSGWWSLRFTAVTGNPNIPVMRSALTSSVDFWYNNRAHFVFADGHVQLLAPDEVKRRYFQIKP
jgi:prepilin-type processing-associated H-X9-DG protein